MSPTSSSTAPTTGSGQNAAPLLDRRQVMTGAGALGLGLALNGGLGLTPALAAPSLEDKLAPRVIGDPNAPILLAEYFSLSCSHCADFHFGAYKKIKSDWIDTGRVRFEMRDFPLRGPAIFAHALARSVPANAYEGMIDILFKQQKQWVTADDPVSALARIARIAGIGNDAFVGIIEDRPLLEGIIAIAQDGYSRWDINSTPSFVVNEDQVIRGNKGYDEFLSVLNAYST
ncbi:MAG: thioredoxin domain-containing protein [Alphaproteobacteria bacterium]|nr:thioredoxin domain-containing protein [Alphaproteobacteria bacterium]